MNIFIAYTNRLVSDGLEAIIKGFDNFKVDQTHLLRNDLLNLTASINGSDVMIVEVDHPKNADLAIINSILKTFPDLRILLISYMPSKSNAQELLNSGIFGYLLKSCQTSDILTALNKIKDHGIYFCSDITRGIVESSRDQESEKDNSLTIREKEILKLLVKKFSAIEIADKLNISENTVKTHKRNVQSKLGAHHFLDLFKYAMQHNYVEISDLEFCSDCPYFMEN